MELVLPFAGLDSHQGNWPLFFLVLPLNCSLEMHTHRVDGASSEVRSSNWRGTMSVAPQLARVLIVDDNPAARLTLQTVLRAGGYWVDCAASAAEAYGKLDDREYELVLSDLGMELPDAGYRVLAHARGLDYRPATALITMQSSHEASTGVGRTLVETEDVEGLLSRVADLISSRAERRMRAAARR
ncbi:MAG: response regulator [Bryobacteraceae bacterium]